MPSSVLTQQKFLCIMFFDAAIYNPQWVSINRHLTAAMNDAKLTIRLGNPHCPGNIIKFNPPETGDSFKLCGSIIHLYSPQYFWLITQWRMLLMQILKTRFHRWWWLKKKKKTNKLLHLEIKHSKLPSNNKDHGILWH